MIDEEPQPRSNTLRIVLIVMGVLIGLCIICWIGSWVIGRIAASQAPEVATMMLATLEQSNPTGGNNIPIATIPMSVLVTPEPALTRRPALTFFPFTPSPSSTLVLPDSALCVPDGNWERGLVIEVLSGDTIRVVVHEQTWLVQYIGIQSPRVGLKSENYAIEAMVANRSMVEYQFVSMVADVQNVDDSKKYMLRYVFVGDNFVNDEMVRRGLARAESIPPNTACDHQFLMSQQQAIDSLQGLWENIPPSSTPEPSTTPRALCDCQGPVLTCSDFASKTEAQTCFDACSLLGFDDVFELDSDNDGLACQ